MITPPLILHGEADAFYASVEQALDPALTGRAYKEFSMRMFGIMRNHSPDVEATRIDEGYVNLTGTLKLHKAPAWEVAHRMLREIRSTLRINVSGGLAGTKNWAEMATSLAKPNGLLHLEGERAALILGCLPARAIPGVKSSLEALRRESKVRGPHTGHHPRFSLSAHERFGIEKDNPAAD